MKLKPVFLAIVIILLGVRIALPTIIVHQANDVLRDVSPDFHVQIRDVDLSFLRLAFAAVEIEAKLKSNGWTFLKVRDAEISLAWRELLRLNILADVVVTGAELRPTMVLIQTVKEIKPTEEDAERLIDKLPIRITSIELRDSLTDLRHLPQIPDSENMRVSNIESRISNVTATKDNPETLVTMQANVLDTSTFKVLATLRTLNEPLAWDLDGELRDFDLKAANPILRNLFPFTFTNGNLELFVEAKSQDGRLAGYIKPYFKKIEVVGNEGDFAGVKHFIFEAAGAIGNLILRRGGEQQSLATKVGFREENGEIKIDTASAIANAIEHGFDEKIAPRLEDSIQLK